MGDALFIFCCWDVETGRGCRAVEEGDGGGEGRRYASIMRMVREMGWTMGGDGTG